MRNWKRRFFVLTRQHLFYYTSDALDAAPVGAVLLADVDFVQQIPGFVQSRAADEAELIAAFAVPSRTPRLEREWDLSPAHLFGLKLVSESGKKDYLLVAPNAGVGIGWCEAIQAARVSTSASQVTAAFADHATRVLYQLQPSDLSLLLRKTGEYEQGGTLDVDVRERGHASLQR